MNLDMIPEETEEELEEEAESDMQWRDNWIIKQLSLPSRDSYSTRKMQYLTSDQPHYVTVPVPEDGLAPRVGTVSVFWH